MFNGSFMVNSLVIGSITFVWKCKLHINTLYDNFWYTCVFLDTAFFLDTARFWQLNPSTYTELDELVDTLFVSACSMKKVG
jgi:hypothetical protein